MPKNAASKSSKSSKSSGSSEAPATFASFDLSAHVRQALEELGFEGPTPVQRDTIPSLLAGRDVIAHAQTGTGKTAAFGIPIVERADPKLKKPQALILAPTRELAVQVAEAIYELGKHRGLRVLPVYGGQPYERQLRGLRDGAQVIVGTPGRVLDHLRRGTLDLSHVALAILDEADEMLNMGFFEDMEAILSQLREARGEGDVQIGLFSATLPPRIRQLAQQFLEEPVRVDVTTGQITVPQIEQVAYEIGGLGKCEALARVLDVETPGSAIVFCATRKNVDEVADRLSARGYRVAAIHGDIAQRDRERVMRAFREGQTEVLVATDVAARGLDVESVTHVINYDVPWDPESYVHRIGRTGRAGRAGDAITLVTPRDYGALRMIERVVKARIARKRLPSLADVATRRREAAKDAVVKAVESGDLDAYLTLAGELGDAHDPIEIAAAALKLWDQARGATGDAQTLASAAAAAQEFEADGMAPERGMTRLFVAMGRSDGLRPQDLVGAIANQAGLRGKEVGAIDIYDQFSFVEVPADKASHVIESLEEATLRNRQVAVRVAREDEQHAEPPPRMPRTPRGPRTPRQRRPAPRHPRAAVRSRHGDGRL